MADLHASRAEVGTWNISLKRAAAAAILEVGEDYSFCFLMMRLVDWNRSVGSREVIRRCWKSTVNVYVMRCAGVDRRYCILGLGSLLINPALRHPISPKGKSSDAAV